VEDLVMVPDTRSAPNEVGICHPVQVGGRTDDVVTVLGRSI
jgi:hypothetical protein